MGETREMWEPQDKRRQSAILHQVLALQAIECETKPMDWQAFMEKKRNELTNTGHRMDNVMFITHLLNSLPQAECEGATLAIKERLRGSTCDLAQVEQLLEDIYLSMKYVKGCEEEEDNYALFASPAKKKGQKKQFKGRCGYCAEIDTRQRIVLRRKARKKRTHRTNLTKRRHKNLKRIVKKWTRPICQNLNVIFAEKWVILLGTARSNAKTIILLEKMSKTENSAN